ncbi:hypothetical protein F7725_013409 [Dissostichus mawsoni]|uniref:Uncharacterized protein n=1 Tax=Dissostichus mawsoni TaxID=36200 RepID=A0A7J5YT84_DISMA|nr:hypothetical protein F7725_013409 [Dissostichus mawsoni]
MITESGQGSGGVPLQGLLSTQGHMEVRGSVGGSVHPSMAVKHSVVGTLLSVLDTEHSLGEVLLLIQTVWQQTSRQSKIHTAPGRASSLRPSSRLSPCSSPRDAVRLRGLTGSAPPSSRAAGNSSTNLPRKHLAASSIPLTAASSEGGQGSQTLHKVCSQGRHFVFRFFRIATASPATSPSSSSRTPTAIPHGGMFELHQILEDRITEHTATVLGLPGRKWRASLVEVDCDQRGVAGLAALLSNLLFILTCTLCACSKKCTTTLHVLQAILHFGPEVGSSTKTPPSHSTHCPMPKEFREC